MTIRRIEPGSIVAIARRCKLLRLAVTRQMGCPDLTQKAFAELAGLATNQWNNVEVGHGRISINAAIKLKRKFGVGVDWIYLGDRAGMPFALMTIIDELDGDGPSSTSGAVH